VGNLDPTDEGSPFIRLNSASLGLFQINLFCNHSMKRSAVVFLVISCFLAGSSPALVKTRINEKITVSLPPGFYAMTPEDVTQRMPSVRAPLGAYTNQDRIVDFSVNISATQWPDADLVIAAKFFKASLYNLYDKVDIIDEGTRVVHRKKYIYFEFESRTNASRRMEGGSEPILKYTYIQYLVEPKQSLVFSFSCPRSLRQDWQDVAHQVMNSVKVK
jgi:hypothetical protein